MYMYYFFRWISRTVKEELKDQVTIKFQMIDDTFSGDKHGSWLSSVIGRGLSVHADAYIPNSVLESELKVRCSPSCALHTVV